MADIESNIRFGVDTSDAIASIKMLQAQISAFQKQMASSSVANAESARKLRRGLVDDLNATGQWSASLKTIKSTSDSFTNALEKNKLSMGEYFRFGASQVTGFRNIFSKEFNTIDKVARERVKDLQTQYISLGRDANGALKAIAVRPLKLDMESLATQTAINAQRQQIFNQLLKQGSTNLLNFGKNTQWAGRQLMVGFTIPLSIFGTTASKTFMQLEEQAIRFKRVYGELFTPPEEADQMLETLKELGKEFTRYGVAVEKTLGLAADAAAMGKTGTDLLDQVTEANRLAVLGNVEQQQALETTISLTNAFGVATQDLAKKIDFLNAVENQTVVSIEDLTIAIPKAGPVVQQLGGDVEDLAFFLTAMKEGGINASEGANALKSGLASLINPTGVASTMLKTFGINIKEIADANRGDVKGLVLDFASALDELNPSQRAQAIEQLFGKFQFARLSTLFQNVIQEGTQASRVLELTNATTQELAQLSSKELRRVEESTTFRFRKAIEEFQLAIAPVGEEFLKLITPIIEFATKIIEKFNSLSDGAKGFITGLTVLLGAVGPVALMTFGLLANGVANIIKGFTFVRELFLRTGKQSNILGEQFDYLTSEQLQASAVAASLDQVHQKLIQTFSSEAGAVENLANIYRRAFNEQQRFDTGRRIAQQSGLKLASGIISVPGPKGAGDVVPAMLSPGEAVIPADAAKKYAPIIQGMIAGNIPGFSKGVFLGMPKKSKYVGQDREVADEIYARFLESNYKNVPPTNYGHQLAKSAGHSFPLFGVGGVYMSPAGKRVFVKPVLDEKAAVAEIRATQIARQAHGLKAPAQRIVVMLDPTDVRRQRKFLALESELDSTFVNNDPMAVFNEDQYFKQLVASLLRVDKDLSASNVFGNVVADVGPAGVFTRASGLRDYASSLPSMEEQAMINLLGIKGGAKRAFAESTLALMAGLTPQQYHQRMISEIQQVLPLLKQTIASFGLTDPTEIKVYADMVKRLEQGLGVDWSKFHAIHSNVKISKKKQSAVPGYADGVVSVPGPKGKGDVMPAMLSPGEAVIPADKARKYAPLISAMIAGKIPGYIRGYQERFVPEPIPSMVLPAPQKFVKPTQARLQAEFGKRGETKLDASHLTSAVPAKALGTLKNALAILGNEVEDVTVQVIEYTEKQDANGKKTRETTASLMKLSEVVQKFGSGYGMVTGGYTYAGSAILEPSVRNRPAYDKMASVMTDEQKKMHGELGAPETLQEVVFHGDLAAKALKQLEGKLTKEVQVVLENIVREGQIAAEALESSSSEQKELDFVIKQRKKAFENKIAADTGLETQQARNAKREELDAKIASIEAAYHRERSQGVTQEQALAKAKARLVVLANEEARLEKEQIQTMHIGKTGQVETNTIREGLRKTSKIRPTAINEAIPHIVGKTTIDTAATMVKDELGTKALIQESKIAQVVRNAIIRIFDRLTDEIIDTARDYAEISSPSRKTGRVGEDLVDGVEVGLLSGQDDAQKAGQIIGESISDGALAAAPTQSGKPGRRARGETVPGVGPIIYNPNKAGDKDQKINERLRQSQELEIQARINNANSLNNSTDRLNKMSSIVMNGTFAISSITGILSMFGGQFAELSQILFGVSTAMFGLMQITQVLAQAKLGELAATRASIAKEAVFGPMSVGKMGPASAAQIAAQNATGFGSKLGVAAKLVTKFLGPIGLAITAFTVLSAVGTALIDAENKRKEALAAFANTINLAADKLDFLASKFGITGKKIDFTQPIVPGQEPTNAPTARELRQDPEFLEKFKAEIESLRASTDERATQQIEGLAMNLEAQGYTAENIRTIINAILQEAQKGQIKLDIFKTNKDGTLELDVNPEKTMQDLISRFQVAGQNLAQAEKFDMGVRKATETFESEMGSAIAYTTAALSQLRSGLQSGEIDAAEYQDSLAQIFDPIMELEGDDLTAFIENLAKSMDIDVDALVSDYDKVLAAKMAVAGLEIDPADVKLLNAGGKEAVAVRKKLNALIENQATNIKDVTTALQDEALIREQVGAAKTALAEENTNLEDQIKAYDILIQQGYEIGDAITYATNATIAQGLASATTQEEIREILNLIDANKILTEKSKSLFSTKGAGEKSPYQQAIESLKEQRKEITNNAVAFAKLRNAGLGFVAAMEAAEDPILAAAIATTKIDTKKWEELLRLIKIINKETEKQAIQGALREGKELRRRTMAFANYSSQLTKLGLTGDEIRELMSDDLFGPKLAEELEKGEIKSESLLQKISQIKKQRGADFLVNISISKEGAAEEFQKLYDKVVSSIESEIQVKEIEFKIATEKDNALVREAENLIAAIQYQIDDYEAELTGIEEQEEVINKKYEDRKKALDDLAKANDSIAKQQKNQLTLADALSQGDIAAAARAVQEIRAQQAQDRLAKQGDQLEISKEKELGALTSKNGRTRSQIEEKIKKLKKDIFILEEEALEVAKERIRQAQIYKEREIESLNSQILKWDELAANVNKAKLSLTEQEKKAMEDQAALISKLLKDWDDIDSKEATLKIIKKTVEDEVGDIDSPKPKEPEPKKTVVTDKTRTDGSSGGPGQKDLGPGPKPPYSPGNNMKWEIVNNKWTAVPIPAPSWLNSNRSTWNRLNGRNAKINEDIKIAQQKKFMQPWLGAQIDKEIQALTYERSLNLNALNDLQTTLNKFNKENNTSWRYASGGFVSGPGTGTSDSIPALLSDGEYVIRSSSVSKLGMDFLDFINKTGKIPGFAAGGKVDPRALIAAAKKADSKIIEKAVAAKAMEKPKPVQAAAPKTAPEKFDWAKSYLSSITKTNENSMPLSVVGTEGGQIANDIVNSVKNIVSGKGDISDGLTVALAPLAFTGLGAGTSKVTSVAKPSLLKNIMNFPAAVKNSLDKNYVATKTEMVSQKLPPGLSFIPDAGKLVPRTTQIDAASPSMYQHIRNLQKKSKALRSLPLRGFEDYSAKTQNIMARILDEAQNRPYRVKRQAQLFIENELPKVLDSRMPGLMSVLETLPQRHRSTQPLLQDFITHPRMVPVTSGRNYGPGTYFARDPNISERVFRDFGNNVYKPKITLPGLMKMLKSKGYLRMETVNEGTSVMAKSKSKSKLDLSNINFENLAWDDPVIQGLIKEGYIGLQHRDAYTNWLIGTNKNFGLKKVKRASGGIVKPAYMRMGGLLPYKAEGGSIFKPLGTDTVPAMLTPGEFVVRKYAVENFGLDRLKAINSGTYNGDSMYNYEVNVNVQTDANPDQIARAVMGQIKQIESQRIRGNRF